MNLSHTAVVLRKRSLTEVFDLGVRFLVALDPRLYVRLSLCVLLPCIALCLAGRYALGLSWGWVWLIAIVLYPLATGPFTIVAGRLVFSEHLELRQVLAQYLRRLPAYLGALALSRLALAALAPTLVGGFVVWINGAFISEAALLEEARPREATRRASRFARGQQSRVLGMLVGFIVVMLLGVQLGDYFSAGVVNHVLGLSYVIDQVLDDGGSAAGVVGLFASAPYVATVRFLSYIDARTVRDGWDIQVRFMQLSRLEPG